MLTIQSPQMPGFATSYDLVFVALALMLALLAFGKRRGVSLRRAGPLDVLPWTGEVVDAGRLAGAVQVRAATLKIRAPHVNHREGRLSANTVDGYG